jgi:hypothetical protein
MNDPLNQTDHFWDVFSLGRISGPVIGQRCQRTYSAERRCAIPKPYKSPLGGRFTSGLSCILEGTRHGAGEWPVRRGNAGG